MQTKSPSWLGAAIFQRLAVALFFRKKMLVQWYYRSKVLRALQLKMVPCLLCGNEEKFTVVQEHDRYDIPIKTQQCDVCGFLMENPAPTEVFLTLFYSSKMYRGLYSGMPKENNPTTESSMEKAKRYGAYLELATRGHTIKNILDVGSAYGYFLLEYQKIHPSCAIYGVEPSAGLRKQYSKAFKGAYADIADIPPEQMFDAITIWHVLEHMKDPITALKKLGAHLKKGGKIILELPDKDNYTSIRSYHIGHLYHFNKESLHMLAQKAGLRVVATSNKDVVDPTGIRAVLQSVSDV